MKICNNLKVIEAGSDFHFLIKNLTTFGPSKWKRNVVREQTALGAYPEMTGARTGQDTSETLRSEAMNDD
jgi:hypothetical protein